MKRKEFITQCSLGCMGLLGLPLLNSCAGTQYYMAGITGSDLVVPLSAFDGKDAATKRSYVVVQNDALEYPICLYRLPSGEFKALLMRCTHQGTELQAYGDRLQCPAHGSEFNQHGEVQNGPADSSLRSFKVEVQQEELKIRLS